MIASYTSFLCIFSINAKSSWDALSDAPYLDKLVTFFLPALVSSVSAELSRHRFMCFHSSLRENIPLQWVQKSYASETLLVLDSLLTFRAPDPVAWTSVLCEKLPRFRNFSKIFFLSHELGGSDNALATSAFWCACLFKCRANFVWGFLQRSNNWFGFSIAVFHDFHHVHPSLHLFPLHPALELSWSHKYTCSLLQPQQPEEHLHLHPAES